MNNFKVLMNGIVKENPTFVLLLGMCPTLGTTSSAINGMGMGLATMFVLICSNVVISAIKNLIPDMVRIPSFIVVIASFVTLLQMVMQAYVPALYVLGKLLVGDILKNQMTPELKEKFLTQFNLTPADIIDRVYRKPFPNRFLASLSPFLAQNLDEPCIRTLVSDSFKAFLKRNVMQYENYRESKVHFIGSVAFYYKTILAEAASEMGIRLSTVIKSPMEGLIEYHK